MKRFFLLLGLLIISVAGISAGEASIMFESKTYDFGKINEDAHTATHEFIFRNTGNAPLIIHRAIASCGCTTPTFTKEPIPAGGKGVIKVTYNTTGRPGAFQKTITIYCNDPKAPNVILSIKGTVIPSADNPEASYPRVMKKLRLSKTRVTMLNARTGNIITDRIDIVNTDSKPLKLTFKKVPSHIRVVASNTLLQPKEQGDITVTYNVSAAKDYGRKEDSFYIMLGNDNKSWKDNRIYVSAYITEDFSRMTDEQKEMAPVAVFSVNRLDFGNMMQKERRVRFLTLSNQGKSPLIIRKIASDYEGLKIIPDKKVIPAGKAIKVKMDFNTGTFNGYVVQRATFFTNDPRNSVSRLFAVAQVTKK